MTTSTTSATPSAAASGTFSIGGDLPVHRLGFGAMRIVGKGVWGPPPDWDEAVRVVRRAVELGVTLIDTADSYGPEYSEQIIGEALRPYPEGVVVATKAGLTRSGPDIWEPVGRPEYLRQQLHLSLRRLGLERIDLYQLHRIDGQVPVEDSVGALAEMQKQGLIRHIGLSEVTQEEIEQAQKVAPIVSVQNRYNLIDREWEPTLEYCEANNIAFIPWFPIAVGKLAQPGGAVDAAAAAHGATPSQVALAWLLRRSPVMLPIPGTGSVAHVAENIGAAEVTLTDEEYAELDRAGAAAS
ncbi:MAG: aldo/keto reductase [Mycobacterium sp.]|nr:aldo/keto reductase [Mycobacterium sp.]